jgi:bacteriocin-like protein
MMTELTDKELDAVSGGSVITGSIVSQLNSLTQSANAVNVLTAFSIANVTQTASQSNNFS